jgi:pimeloyl-ACP methyl ester carboxylesterase
MGRGVRGTIRKESTMNVRGLVVFGLAGLALVGCGEAVVELEDTDALVDPAYYKLPISTLPCGMKAFCFWVEVPVDPDLPDGETIQVRGAMLPAQGEAPIGVLAVNFGGFGVPGVPMLEDWASTVPELRQNFHLVSWDPRGSGGSSPLTCAADFAAVLSAGGPVETLAEAEAHVAVRRAFLEDCRRQHGDMIDHMGYRAHAADLDAVRAALDVPRMHYLGYSAGTALGQVYAEFYPERLFRVAWDSAIVAHGGARTVDGYQAPGAALALDDFAASCAASPECGLEDPLATLEDLFAKADDGELLDRDGVPLTWLEAAYGAVLPLYSPGGYPALFDVLHHAEQGDGDYLAFLSGLYLGSERRGSVDPQSLVFQLTQCAEELVPTSAEDYLEATRAYSEHSVFGPVFSTDYAWCAALGAPVAPLGRAMTAPDVEATILVLQAEQDIATPLVAGEEVAKNVGARLVVYEGAGHTPSTFNGCMEDVLMDYLVRGVVPDEGTRCAEGR